MNMIYVVSRLKCFVAVKVLLLAATLGFSFANVKAKAEESIGHVDAEASSSVDGITNLLNRGLDTPPKIELIHITSVTIDPRNSKILYASTIDGLFKSIDRGENWSHVNKNIEMLGALAIDPKNPSVMYANAIMDDVCAGIIKSTDSGVSWHMLLDLKSCRQFSINILIDPDNSSIVYVTDNECIHKSTDAGLNWEKMLLDPDYLNNRILAIDLKKPSILYAGIITFDLPIKIFKSLDVGKNWIDINNGIDNMIEKSFYFSYLKAIAVSTYDSNLIYALFRSQLFKSVDGGNSWKELKNTPSRNNDAFHYKILVTNNPKIMYLDTSKGLYFSGNGGKSWKLRLTQHTVSSRSSEFITVDPYNPKIIYAGSIHVLYRSTNTGRTWKDIARGFIFKNKNTTEQ